MGRAGLTQYCPSQFASEFREKVRFHFFGIELGYAAMGCLSGAACAMRSPVWDNAVNGQVLPPTALRECYAMSSTDITYPAISSLRTGRY
eukprot:1849230-Rhodomonas_salina.2